MSKYIILALAILLSATILGGSYIAVEYNKQQSIEKQLKLKIEAEEQERVSKEVEEQEAKEEAKQALNSCIAEAEENYSDQWYRECKSQGSLTSKCIELKEMTFDEYVEQNNISQDKRLSALFDFYKERDNCSCRLPLANADRINERLEKNKDDCFKKYPQK